MTDPAGQTHSLPCEATPRVPLKLGLMYLWRNRYWPNLADPRRFNELIQVRKLYDRSPLLPMLADKVRVKEHVARLLGEEWVIPTLWHGTQLPERPEWPLPFVVKSSHATGQCAFIRTGREDWPAIRRRAERWLRRSYGGILDEWLYAQIEPQLLVEPFIGNPRSLPVDYKILVFGGRARIVQVDTDREHGHKRTLYDLDWRRLPVRFNFPNDPRELERPRSLPLMIEAAETLGRGFDFVRVDLYEVEGRPLFGEMTFYPGSGLDRFTPREYDRLFGEYWLEACRGSPG